MTDADELLSAFESPETYWAAVPEETRAVYQRFYACEQVDPMFVLQLRALWDGEYPSLRD